MSGSNATGFALFEYGIRGKWLELLKEIGPRVTRAAVLRDSANRVAGGQLGAIRAVAPSFGVDVSPVGVDDAPEIERAITAFARGSQSPVRIAAFPQELAQLGWTDGRNVRIEYR